MRGMNNTTGKPIEGLDYLRQRLTDVLTTPKGTRLMRRDYGSGLFDLVDQAMNDGWLVQCYGAIAEAIADPVNGLPDFRLERIEPSELGADGGVFELTGVYLPTAQRVSVSAGAAA